MSRWVEQVARASASRGPGRRESHSPDDRSVLDTVARAVSTPLRRRELIVRGGAAVGAAALADSLPLRAVDAMAQTENCTPCGNVDGYQGYCPCHAPVCCVRGENSHASNYCCQEGTQCCMGTRETFFLRDTCCPPEGTCYVDAKGSAHCCPAGTTPCEANDPENTSSRNEVDCCENGQTCENGVCVGEAKCPDGRPKCEGVCCDPGTVCDPDTARCVPGCPQGRVKCGDVCCEPGQTCDPATTTCVTPCPDGRPRCNGKCCEEGQTCEGGVCTSCEGQRDCVSFCCPEGQFCCDPEKRLCCPDDTHSCCNTTGPGGTPVPTCCPTPSHRCSRQIVGRNAGLTKDSPTVCCPPERLNTYASTASPICCPPGSVPHPSGKFTVEAFAPTWSAFCCPVENVCGQSCCVAESQIGIERHCCNGKCCTSVGGDMKCLDGECVPVTHAEPAKSVTAQSDGDVPVPVDCPGGGCSGTASISTAGGGSSVAFLAARAVPLGQSRFRIRRRGKKKVEIQLSRRGMKMLKRRGQLRVTVTVKTRQGGKRVTSTSKPFTLKAPKRRGG